MLAWFADRARVASALAVVAILCVAAFFHHGAATRTVVNIPLRADAKAYFFSAYNVAHFGVYSRTHTLARPASDGPPAPDSLVSPGYPLLMLALGTPEPRREYMERLRSTQVVLGVGAVLLFFFIASAFLPRGWSHASTLLVALEPHLQIMSGYFLTETLFTFLLFLTVLLGIQAAVRQRAVWFLATGLACGACALTRPTVQFLPWLAFAATVLVPGLRPHLRFAGVALATFLLVTAPWALRNRSIPHDPAEPSLAVSFLLHGSYPGFMYRDIRESYGSPYRFDPNVEAARKNIGTTLMYIADRAAAEPLRFAAWYLVGKPGFFLSWSNVETEVGDIYVYPPVSTPYRDEAAFIVVRKLMFFLHWPLMLGGLLGVVLAWRGAAVRTFGPSQVLAARLVSLVILYAIAFHMVGAPYPRYGIPFRPLLFPFALLAVLLAVRARRASAGAG